MLAKYFALVGLVFSVTAANVLVSRTDAAEPKQLFQSVNLETMDLNPKQARILERLKGLPTSKDVSVVTFKPSSLDTADSALNIVAGPQLEMQINNFRVTKEKIGRRLDWAGERRTENVTLRVAEKNISGLIMNGKDVYSVEPLGGGLHAVVKLDQSKFPKDHPEEAYKEIEEAAATKEKVDNANKGADTPPKNAAQADVSPPSQPVVRVFVAYTNKVDDEQADVNQLIQSAVDLGSTAMANSHIHASLELVGTAKMNYAESGSFKTDLDQFEGKTDGFMDNIHALRDASKADACVLLIDNSSSCGLASEIWATDESQAFVVVHHDCAKNNLSLAHELGHIFGARHNLLVDPTLSPFADGHCHLSTTDSWRTVMAYPTTANPNRLPYWSNPDVSINGEPTGILGKEDNARVLNQTIENISKFRQ